MGRYTAGGVGRDILAGAVAGVAAIWVADKLDQAIYRSGGPEGVRKTEAARPGGMDPAHVLAKRAADLVGADLGDAKNNPAGQTVHYGIAGAMGALYGLLRGMTPAVSTGRGALFGIGMFVLQDEIGNTMMGTAGNPLNYPIRDHARGAATHTLFGFVTDLGTRLMSPWRDAVVIEQGPPLSERLDRGRAYLAQGRDDLSRLGRQNLDQGRAYLGQGVSYASQLAGQARQAAGTVRSQLPDYDAAEVARLGRGQLDRYASVARSSVPDVSTSGFARAVKRLFA